MRSTSAVVGHERPPAVLRRLVSAPRSGARLQAVLGLLVLVAAFGVQFADRALGQYGDESDNLLGGSLVAHGQRLYVDYFSQHMPLPYYVAAGLAKLGVHDLEGYRVGFALVVTAVIAYVLVRFHTAVSPVLLLGMLAAWLVGQPMFSGQMLLADQFFALALLVLVLFLLLPDLPRALGDQVAVSLAVFAAFESTLISVYPLLVLGVYYVVQRVRSREHSLRHELRFLGIILLPHVILGLGLLVSGTLGAAYDQAIRFNQQYYAHYELAGDPLSILGRAVTDYASGIPQYLWLGAPRDVEGFLFWTNLLAVVVLWRTRGVWLAVCYFGVVVLSQMRGNSGYHGAPYFAVSFISLGLLLAACAEVLRQQLLPKVRRNPVLLGAAIIYAALALLFYRDIAGFFRQQQRGVGLDSPYAGVIQATTQPGDVVWAAPFEPYVYLLADRAPASPYWYYFPWLADSPEITDALLHDLATRQPPVIVFLGQKQIPWYVSLPTPQQYGARVYQAIQAAYDVADPNDPVLRDVYFRKDLAPTLRARLQGR